MIAKSNWFIEAMRENQAYDWAPMAPFRDLIEGEKDVDVPPADSKAFVAGVKLRGGNVEPGECRPLATTTPAHGLSRRAADPVVVRRRDSLALRGKPSIPARALGKPRFSAMRWAAMA